MNEEHLAHLQAILDHEDNDLSPNDKLALQYFIDREPLVQRLIARLDPDDPIEPTDIIEHGWVREMEGDARAVRDFKLGGT